MARTAGARKRKREADAARANAPQNRTISIHDESAWDDSELTATWDQAVAQYNRWHSVKKTMTAEAIEELLEQMERAEDEERDAAEDHEVEEQEAEDGEYVEGEDGHTSSAVRAAETQHDQVALPPPAAAAPANLAGLGITDPAMQNIMMSWYWAGYYTGFSEGQQAKANATVSNGPSSSGPNGVAGGPGG